MIWPSLVCLALVALLAYREWGARRERRETSHVIIQERLRAAEERRELYQRIQAPQEAVIEHTRRERGPHTPRRPIAADDDARFAARDAVAKSE